MIHLGDITKLHGDAIPPVDCITGGSPCQDLSVAGKRAGLAGERSGLFMEQIRIVKEMRARDIRAGRTGYLIRPRYMVWENVPGAFSSNKGEDFRAVLEEIVKVVEADAPDVPLPDKGKWTKAGCLYDELGRWSIAWRLHDAQFWGATQFIDGRVWIPGTPQRRKRIALVADFGGLAAPEILFERKGVSGDPEPCGASREEAAGAAGGGAESAGGAITIDPRQLSLVTQKEMAATLGANAYKEPQAVLCTEPILLESNQNHATIQTDGISTALPASMGMGGGYVPMVTQGGMAVVQETVYDARGNGDGETVVYENHSQDSRYKPLGDVSETVSAKYGTGGNNQPLVVSDALCIGNGQADIASHITTEVAQTLNCMHDPMAVCVGSQVNAVFARQRSDELMESEVVSTQSARQYKDATDLVVTSYTQSSIVDPQSTVGALCARDYKGVGNQYVEEGKVVPQNSTVRRLTPLECERLQGFPDGWTDIGDWVDSKGKRHKAADSPRYKALGNSIALPFWFWLLRRISATYERPATLGSLFDGIGGFPLCWERCNGKGTAIWASEIEDFPIAVTKYHFPEGEA